MDSEIQETLDLFKQAFSTFNRPKINAEQLREMFILMEMPPLNEEEFQLQFANLDQDKDGLINFDDFKVYIMLNAVESSQTSANQLTIEDISYMNELYDRIKTRTNGDGLTKYKQTGINQFRKVAQAEGMIEVFERFFKDYEFEIIDDETFTERVERFENVIFGIPDLLEAKQVQKENKVKQKIAQKPYQQINTKQNSQSEARKAEQLNDINISSSDLNLSSKEISRTREDSGITEIKTRGEQVIGICIGYLTEADNTQLPENKIQDVLNLLLDNPCSVQQNEMAIFITNLANVHKQVQTRIGDFDDQTSRLKRDFEEQFEETQEAKQQYIDCKAILTSMQVDYLQMQKQIGEILPQKQMLTQLKQRNGQLTTQLFERNNEIGKLKSELFASQQSERDYKNKVQEIEEKLLDAETETRQVRAQQQDGGAGIKRNQSKFNKRGTLAFGQNRQTQMQSFLMKKSSDQEDRDQSMTRFDNQQLIDQEELTEALEQNYLKQLAILTNNQKLSSLERQSLQSIIQQYESYKQNWQSSIEEAEDAALELENLEETVQKLTEEVEYQKKINADDRKQLELTKVRLEQVKIEREQLQSEVETLQLELIQGNLFAEAGLVGEQAKIKGDNQNNDFTYDVQSSSNKPVNKLEELQSMNLQNYETVDELNFARASQFQDDFIQSDDRGTLAPTGQNWKEAGGYGLDQIQEVDENRESAVSNMQYNNNFQEQDYYQDQQADDDQFEFEKDVEPYYQQDIFQDKAKQSTADQNQQFISNKQSVLESQTVQYSQPDKKELNEAGKSDDFKDEAEDFNPVQDQDEPDVEIIDSNTRGTAVRVTKNFDRITESGRRSAMKELKQKKKNQRKYVSDDSYGDEYGDKVESLYRKSVQDQIFDSVLESTDSSKPQRTESPPKQKLEPERLGSTITDLLNRSKDFAKMRQQTLLQTSSNRKDFDYLSLRRVDNKKYKKVDKILQDNYEGTEHVVFSDNIQQFDNNFKITNRIIIITSQSFYILNKNFQFVKRDMIKDLRSVILIKTNASIFSLNFVNMPPLLFQTFRRTELTVFLLAQGENLKNKPQILRTNGLQVTSKNGKTQQLYFDKQDTLKTSSANQIKLLRNLQLNNFANSIMCGYLEKLDYTWFGSVVWEEKFFVLSNVGLLYFTDPLKPPSDLFPVLDCEIKKLKRGDEGYTDGYETLRLVYSRKTIIFRCLSVTDYDQWFKAIMTLQSQSEEKRSELKISEDLRLTTIARGLGVQVMK